MSRYAVNLDGAQKALLGLLSVFLALLSRVAVCGLSFLLQERNGEKARHKGAGAQVFGSEAFFCPAGTLSREFCSRQSYLHTDCPRSVTAFQAAQHPPALSLVFFELGVPQMKSWSHHSRLHTLRLCKSTSQIELLHPVYLYLSLPVFSCISLL